LLFSEGFDPNFGARPLKRAIQKLIQDPLALKILDGEVLHGDHVVVDAKNGKMQFEVSKRIRCEGTYCCALRGAGSELEANTTSNSTGGG
jgi:hypothetical protein